MTSTPLKFLAVAAMLAVGLSPSVSIAEDSGRDGSRGGELNDRAITSLKNDSTVRVMPFAGSIITQPPFNNTECGATTATWEQGGYTCSAELPATLVNLDVTITDPADSSGSMGSALWHCASNGAWDGSPTSATCGPEVCLSKVVNWSQGANNCSASLPDTTPGDMGQAVDPSGDSTSEGAATYQCNADGTWSNTPSSATCEPAHCDSSQLLSWEDSSSGSNIQCETYPPRTQRLQSVLVTDNTGSETGSARFQCDTNGNWSDTGTSPYCVKGCPAGTQTWSGYPTSDGSECSADVAASLPNTSTSLTDNSGPTQGSATLLCKADGTWERSGNSSCQFTCPSKSVSWDDGAGTQCEGTLSSVNGGQAITATNTNPTASGFARYQCNGDGTWANTPMSSTCEPVCPESTVGWQDPTTGVWCHGAAPKAAVGTTQFVYDPSENYYGDTYGDSSATCQADLTWTVNNTGSCSRRQYCPSTYGHKTSGNWSSVERIPSWSCGQGDGVICGGNIGESNYQCINYNFPYSVYRGTIGNETMLDYYGESQGYRIRKCNEVADKSSYTGVFGPWVPQSCDGPFIGDGSGASGGPHPIKEPVSCSYTLNKTTVDADEPVTASISCNHQHNKMYCWMTNYTYATWPPITIDGNNDQITWVPPYEGESRDVKMNCNEHADRGSHTFSSQYQINTQRLTVRPR